MNRSGTWKRISRNWGLYLLLLPSLVLLILFAYKPMYGVVIAMTSSLRITFWITCSRCSSLR